MAYINGVVEWWADKETASIKIGISIDKDELVEACAQADVPIPATQKDWEELLEKLRLVLCGDMANDNFQDALAYAIDEWIADPETIEDEPDDMVSCPACKGTGTIGENKCHTCWGQGQVEEPEARAYVQALGPLFS